MVFEKIIKRGFLVLDYLIANIVMLSAFVPVSVIATALAFLYTKHFSGTPFEKPWKILFLIPIYILAAVIVEIAGIGFPHLRFLGAAIALLTLLYALYRFYKTLTIVQPYTGSIIVKFEPGKNDKNAMRGLMNEENERVLVKRDVYEKLIELANERSMTINQFVYKIVVPEWLAIRYKSKYYKDYP